MEIQIEMLTKDERMVSLCSKYWLMDEEEKFVFKVRDIAKEFSIRESLVGQYARDYCRAYKADFLCEKCGKPVMYLKNRSHLVMKEVRFPKIRYCERCKSQPTKGRDMKYTGEVLARVDEGIVERRDAETLREEKTKKMIRAYEDGAYESLSSVEFNYLIALARSKSTKEANRNVGLSWEDSAKIIEKLNHLHLLNWCVGINGYAIEDPFRTALKRIGYKRRVKPIFGSVKAHELFRKLRREYLFVYPEIPVCAFIRKEDVEHLFTESWHFNYFLTCRVDFVVCEADGTPSFAVEYHGGYHKSEDQAVRDAFKRALLEEVGLSLIEYNNQSLSMIS